MTDPIRPSVANSLVVPVYENEANLPDLLSALRDLHADLAGDLEVVLVVDGSPDQSWAILRDELSRQPFQSQLLLLSRNFGSFAAIRRGLAVASGSHLAVMAADLQEPIELVLEFFRILGEDRADVLLGRRTSRADAALTKIASGVFWRFYRRWVMREMPVGGVDIFACSAPIRDELVSMTEANTSLVSQLVWLGGRRLEIPYERRARQHGASAWTLAKRVRYTLDSILAFSDLPIFLLLWVGTFGLLTTLGAGVVVGVAWSMGYIEVQGYTPIMLLVSLIGSMLIFGQGIIGSYVWRANENAKGRPLSLTQSHERFSGVERSGSGAPPPIPPSRDTERGG
jgi:glycosyltransferase involved in cell wall biosynthesis